MPVPFSHRLTWDLPTNPLSRLHSELMAAGVPLLDLTASNPTGVGLPLSKPQDLAALSDPAVLQYEATPLGLPPARAAITAYYAERGFSVPPGRLLLTASTSEAYSFLFKLLCDPGDAVLVPRPSYPLFEYLAFLESIEAPSYPLVHHEGWFVDKHALIAAITPRTRAIVLVNPNNPTGSYLKREELAWLLPLCQEFNLALISDEVFADYAYEPDDERVRSMASVSEVLSFALSGLSKVAGLPQLKLGWIAVNGPELPRSTALARLELIADTYLAVGTPVQIALPRLLAGAKSFQDALQRRLLANRQTLAGELRGKAEIQHLQAEGGWYSTLRLPRSLNEEQWVLTLLREYQVVVQPGFFYDFASEAHVILSLLTPEEPFREGVQRIVTAIEARTV